MPNIFSLVVRPCQLDAPGIWFPQPAFDWPTGGSVISICTNKLQMGTFGNDCSHGRPFKRKGKEDPPRSSLVAMWEKSCSDLIFHFGRDLDQKGEEDGLSGECEHDPAMPHFLSTSHNNTLSVYFSQSPPTHFLSTSHNLLQHTICLFLTTFHNLLQHSSTIGKYNPAIYHNISSGIGSSTYIKRSISQINMRRIYSSIERVFKCQAFQVESRLFLFGH